MNFCFCIAKKYGILFVCSLFLSFTIYDDDEPNGLNQL